MNNNDVRNINVEFFTPYNAQLDNLCTIVLYKKTYCEVFAEHSDMANNFRDNEDLFISWLASIASSKGYPLAKAVLKSDNQVLEALYSSVKQTRNIGFPCLSKVRRIYVIQKSTQQEKQMQDSKGIGVENRENLSTVIIQDFSNDEVYIFDISISITDPSKVEAIVIETDKGIMSLRTNDIISSTSAQTDRKNKKNRKRKRKRTKKSKRSRRLTKSSSQY